MARNFGGIISILERRLIRGLHVFGCHRMNTVGAGGTTQKKEIRNGTPSTGRKRSPRPTDSHHSNNGRPAPERRTTTATINNQNPPLTHEISRRLPFLQSTTDQMRRRETRLSELHDEIAGEDLRISIANNQPPPPRSPSDPCPGLSSCPWDSYSSSTRLDFRRDRHFHASRLTSLPPLP